MEANHCHEGQVVQVCGCESLSEEANPMFGSHLEIIPPQNKRVGQQSILHKTREHIYIYIISNISLILRISFHHATNPTQQLTWRPSDIIGQVCDIDLEQLWIHILGHFSP